jgi:hypothetical protein
VPIVAIVWAALSTLFAACFVARLAIHGADAVHRAVVRWLRRRWRGFMNWRTYNLERDRLINLNSSHFDSWVREEEVRRRNELDG